MAAGTAVKAPAEYRFTVNGEEQVVTTDKPLLRYLRDDLKLTSVKDGCSEGACGTCTVLVDDRATKACVLTTRLAAGRDIVTVEGLPHEEQEAFVYAFGAVGAVQCGFCIPGMVMAGAALIHKVPDPTEDQVKAAIRGNVCRCTGYKKIIEGILLAAAILRGEKSIDPNLERGDDYGVGKRAFRVDVRRKVLGYGKYPDDIDERDFPDLTYASAVRSKYPRARVVKIDAEKARAMPGVLAVLTAADVPVNAVGHLLYDWDVMTAEGDVTHCVGDAIALVVAEDAATLEKAKKAVKVEYEVLEPVRSIEEARAEGFGNWVTPENNICQQRHVVRGDAAAALAGAAHKVTRTFKTPFTEHAFLEPECAVAFPYKGGVKVCSSDQGAYDSRKEIAHMLGWDATPEKVVVETMLVGGGFGGKEDVSVQHLAALAALAVNRPVKVRLTRQESINFHPKRHYMEGTFTLGCDEDGTFRRSAARSSSAPARTPWARTATRTRTSAALAGTPTTRPPARSAASASARASLRWRASSTFSPTRWASPRGRSATATPSSPARSCPTARSPTAPPPSRRPCSRCVTSTRRTPVTPASRAR